MGKVQRPRVQAAKEFKKNNFPVTVKIRTSRYQTLDCFIATLPTYGVYGSLVHVGETFWTVSCTKMRLAAGDSIWIFVLGPEFLVTPLHTSGSL